MYGNHEIFLTLEQLFNTAYMDQMCLRSEIIALAEGFVRHFHKPQMVETENQRICCTFYYLWVEIVFLSLYKSLVGMSSIAWPDHHQPISHYFGMSPSALDGHSMEYGVCYTDCSAQTFSMWCVWHVLCCTFDICHRLLYLVSTTYSNDPSFLWCWMIKYKHEIGKNTTFCIG